MTVKERCGGITSASNNNIKCTNCYYNSELTLKSSTYPGVTGCTTAQMQTQSTYEGWDFDNVWYMDESTGYPKLRVFKKD